jgi:hypothetical protein
VTSTAQLQANAQPVRPNDVFLVVIMLSGLPHEQDPMIMAFLISFVKSEETSRKFQAGICILLRFK